MKWKTNRYKIINKMKSKCKITKRLKKAKHKDLKYLRIQEGAKYQHHQIKICFLLIFLDHHKLSQ